MRTDSKLSTRISTDADLHVSSGCVRMDENAAIPNALKDALIKDLHASHQAAGEWYAWPSIAGGYT